MTVALILVVLAILAVIAVMVINRTTGPRPDRPMAGAPDDAHTPTDEQGQDGGSSQADRPGGPGQESMNPEQFGAPSPGPLEEDRPRS